MNDSVLIWEKYSSLHEANLISKDPLHLELEKLLKEKNVQKPEIVNWFLKTYIKWFQSPADDNIKTPFISKYTAKETDPEWSKKEGIFQFNNFTSEYKDRLSHLIDFLNTKDDNYLKSLYKVTVPQMFEEVQKWDEEMARSAEKAKKAKLQSVEGIDYKVVGIYDGYPVWELTSNKSFREESMYMGHCVGQAEGESQVTSVEGGESRYFKEYKKHKLEIYSLRDPKEYNHPVATFELQEDPEDGEFVIVQIKGPANRVVSERYRKACREFIEDKDYIVKHDGENIGMVKWKNMNSLYPIDKYYFEDSEEFKNIYYTQILPKQKKYIEETIKRIENNTIKGDVYLNDIFLNKLPNLSNVKIIGDFTCSNNNLTSLEGAPKEVDGGFYCGGNQLISLEGAPQKVENFICSYNNLTNLKGSPEQTFYFDCSYNKLTTLEGSPKSAYEFNCSYNQLTTLEGAPYRIVANFLTYENPVKFTKQDKEEAMENSRKRNETKLESFKNFFYIK